MMKLSIYRCVKCGKIRLVDKVNEEWICFACKQSVKRKPISIEEVKVEKPKTKTTKKPKAKKSRRESN